MFPTLRDFRVMTEATQTGILIHEAASKNILWANPSACEMFGFTLEELRPLKAHHMSSQERAYRRSVGVAWLQEAVVRGTSRWQWKYQTKTGDEFLTDVVASLVQFQEGPMIMVQLRNIAQEAELKEELSRVSHSLQRIMTHTSAGILTLDEDNRIEEITPLAARLYGETATELIGRRLDELGPCSPPLDDGQAQARLASSVGTGSVRITQQIQRDDGAVTWLTGELEAVDHDGMTSWMLVVRDVTERVEMERRQAYQEANLQYLSRYNAMGDMVMVLAHEIAQPLAASTNYLSGLKARAARGPVDTDELAYVIGHLEKQLSRAGEIVTSVKHYVRRIESTKAPIDLVETADESLYFVGLRAQEHGVELIVERGQEPLPVEGESVLIGQVIINLCFNAIDEIVLPTTELKQLTVRISRRDRWACVSVLDQGRGVKKAPGDRLRSGAFSDKQDGSGLGLILSEHIVERHGGQIQYLPNSPSGSEIRLLLPLR